MRKLNFISESDMAPNAEEDLLVTMSCGLHPATKKPAERLRPPTYNAEDYAIALRRWGRRPVAMGGPDTHGTLPSTCTSSSSGYASGNGEMTLRQFTSVTELLNKLKQDLTLAFPSFVQEFATEGLSLLLETLRGVQLAQTGSNQTGPFVPGARRAALDELTCLECIWSCVERCPEATRLLVQAQSGLIALTVCFIGSLNKSRIIALQLLTRVCQVPNGHSTVSDAMSTLRLRYAEGGRFRFLAGALLAGKAQLSLRVSGLNFINAFMQSAPRLQNRFYIQAELFEAGLDPKQVQEWLQSCDPESLLVDQLRDEYRRWAHLCVDVEGLKNRAEKAEDACKALNKKITALQKQIQNMQMERINNDCNGRPMRDFDYTSEHEMRREKYYKQELAEPEKKLSSGGEDEGISFSERSSSSDGAHQPEQELEDNLENDDETTIDDVIEELNTIVKDAEEEMHTGRRAAKSAEMSRNQDQRHGAQTDRPSKAREWLHRTEETARMDRGLSKSAPLKIMVPGPAAGPKASSKKGRPGCVITGGLFKTNYPSHHSFVEPDEQTVDSYYSQDERLLEDDDCESLLSASQLRAQQQQQHHDCAESGRIYKNNGETPKNQASNAIQKKSERRKLLRRSQSQDPIGSHARDDKQSYKAKGVMECIRKFESMTNFGERRSLPNLGDVEGNSAPIRRSESFHQTSNRSQDQARGRKDEFCSSSVENYNTTSKITKGKRGQCSKSLDRSRHEQVVQPTYRRLSSDDGLEEKPIENYYREQSAKRAGRPHYVPPEDYGHVQMRSLDAFYQDMATTHFTSFRGPQTMERDGYRDRKYVESSMKHGNESRLFAGRPHDVLGFSKNRFNAGKYSGNNHQMQFARNIHRHMNVPAAMANGHLGKVTDYVSGLY